MFFFNIAKVIKLIDEITTNKSATKILKIRLIGINDKASLLKLMK